MKSAAIVSFSSLLISLLFAGPAWVLPPGDSKATSETRFNLDFNVDGRITVADLLLLLEGEGTSKGEVEYEIEFDLDRDGQVGPSDVFNFTKQWNGIAPPRSPVEPDDLRQSIQLANGTGQRWAIQTIRPNERPPGLTSYELVIGPPSLWEGVLAQSVRSEPAPKAEFLLSADGNLEVLQVRLPNDIPVMPGLTVSSESELLSSPVPLTNPGIVESGSTVVTNGTGTVQVLVGPKAELPMEMEVSHETESTITDMSETGDWSQVHLVTKVSASAGEDLAFDGGIEMLFGESGLLFLQTFQNRNGKLEFRSYERVERSSGDCPFETEPNDDLASGELVTPPACRKGNARLESEDMVDYFRIQTPEKKIVRIEVEHSQVSSAQVTLRGQFQQAIQSETFSSPGVFTFDDIVIDPNQTYSMELHASPVDKETFFYEIAFQTVEAGSCVVESEPNDEFYQGDPLYPVLCAVGTVTTGSDETDVFGYFAQADGTVNVDIQYETTGGAEGFLTLFKNDEGISDNAVDLRGADTISLHPEPVVMRDRVYLRVLIDWQTSPPESEISYEIRLEFNE